MKVAYATIVYKNRRQKYYLFLYKPHFFVIFLFFICSLFDNHFIGEYMGLAARTQVPGWQHPIVSRTNLHVTGFG